MTLDEQLEILQAAKRGEKIEWAFITLKEPRGWYEMLDASDRLFNFQAYDYRIADPYAELKAAALDPTKQIRYGKGDWFTGDDTRYWEFDQPINNYEIRDKPKPKEVVKYLCYEDEYGYLQHVRERLDKPSLISRVRRPAFDMECEVEDE
jgi:hypothetical protein